MQYTVVSRGSQCEHILRTHALTIFVFRKEVCDLKHTLHVWLTVELVQLQQLTDPCRFDTCGPQIDGNNADSLNHMELPSWRMPLTHAAQTRTTPPDSAHDFGATGLLSSTDFCPPCSASCTSADE